MKKFLLIGLFGLVLIGIMALIPSGRSAITFVDSDNGYYQIRLRTSGYTGDDTMNEIYLADLSTKTPLHTRTGLSSTDSNWLTFDRDMRIEDSKGFNNTQFTLRIYSVTGVLTTGTIEINTTMFDKTKTTHSVVFTTAGTYNIINTGDVVIFSNGSKITNYVSTGSFSYQINQSRFGCISKNARSYTLHNAWLNIGQSATSCSALFQRCQIYFNNTHENYGQSAFIQVLGSTSDLTFKNVSMFSRFNATYLSGQKTISSGGCNLYLLNFSYDCANTTVIELGTTTRKLFAYNCLLKDCTIYNGNLTMDNVIIYNVYTNNYALYNNKIFSISDLIIKNVKWGMAVNGNFNLTGVRFVKNTFTGIPILFSGSVYLIDCTSDVWSFDSGFWTGKLYRSNSLYLRTVVNGTSVNLSGVSVIIKNVTGVTKKTLTTDANGLISRQILNYYTWTNYNVGFYDSPYTIYLSKSGYQNEVFKVSMDNINNLTIPMVTNITIPSASLILFENIGYASGTHQSQYNSLTGWKVWANYTGSSGGGIDFLVHNPNPGDTTGFNEINYLQANGQGMETAVDVIDSNFTELTYGNLGDGHLIEWYNSPVCLMGRSSCYGSMFYGQTFRMGNTGTNEYQVVNNITLYLSKRGSPIGNLEVYIYDVKNYTNFLGYTDRHPYIHNFSVGYIPCASIGLGFNWFNITMTPFLLKPDTNYSIVIANPDNIIGSNFIVWGYDECSIYSPGDYNVNGLYGAYPYWDREDGQDFLFEIWGWSLGTDIPWKNVLNLSFTSNSSGLWAEYGKEYAVYNGTVFVVNTNMTVNHMTFWWNVSCDMNGLAYGSNSFWFTTGSSNVFFSTEKGSSLIMATIIGISGCSLGFIYKKRKKDERYQRD